MLKRCKASFMVLIIVVSVFTVSLVKPVSAIEVCCEKTIVGTSCVNTDESNCDPTYSSLASNCVETDFCKVGCCVDKEGGCHEGVPKAICLDADGGWNSNCDIGACKKACCVVKGECSYVTETQCDNIVSKYEGVEKDFMEVGSEEQCSNICRGEEEGCCISAYGCDYGGRDSCYGNFNYGRYCSEFSICDCESHAKKGCYNNNVYWFDSCGNREEILQYCNYNDGFICGEVNGEYTCKSVNCETTYDDEKNVHDPRLGGFRKNGESWCIYESPVGDFRDRPGTRHYRYMCINGEEMVESCRDFRDEICVQSYKKDYTESQCLHNNIYDSKIDSRISTVPIGFRFWEEEGGCDAASIECKVIYVKKSRFSDWKCTHNCECETQEWTDKMAEFCKSLGDCGADYNILGVKTTDGFSMSGAPGSPSESKWNYWNEYGVFGGIKTLGESIGGLGSGTPEEPGSGIMEAMFAGGVTAAVLTALSFTSAGSFLTAGGFVQSLPAIAGMGVTVIGLAIVVAVAAITYFIFGGGGVKTITVKSTCSPWQAPDGGSDCGKCDELHGECTEYRCKSLGKLCDFIPENVGSGRVSCYNSHPNDVNSPKISPWEDVLTESYNIEETAMGYKIIPKIDSYKVITFGIKTDEMAQCRFSMEHKQTYNEMPYYFGESYYSKEHNMSMSLDNGKVYDFYVRCKDPSGNWNLNDYVIHIETEEGPDLTSPVIDYFEPNDGSFVQFNVSEIAVSAYVNEPVTCKWDYDDKSYSNMNNWFVCEQEISIGDIYYECLGVLNVSLGENVYYVKCKDHSNNTNIDSFVYYLYGSGELRVTSLSPSGILYDTNNPTLQIKTEGGIDGTAKCYFSEDYINWIEFFDTDSSSHLQPLTGLAVGDYDFYVKCFDRVNEANGTISFRIDRDITAPTIVYIFADNTLLHIILNEDADCEYSDSSFSFGEGNLMSKSGLEHSAPLADFYYINCKDVYENEMGELIVYP
jgi:hypothetical protein